MNSPPRNPGVTPASKARSQHTLIVAGLVAVMFLALGFIGYRWIKNEPLATLVQFSGEAERDMSSSVEQWSPAKNSDKFKNGDGARTGENATAEFRLINGAKLKLKPASQIRFKDRNTSGKPGLGVDVSVGEADIESSAAITIDSEFGEIVLDANSAITMSREGGRLVVDVELGRIELGEERRAVAAGENLELELGGIVVDVAAEADATAVPTATAPPVEEPPPLDVGDGVERADLSVSAGQSFVVHDPSPPTAIGFNLGTLCEGGARLTSGEKKTEARLKAKLEFGKGQHAYEVRCLDKPDVVVAQGSVRVLHDAGTRPLPSFTPKANVTTDGRRYTVLYQHRLPSVTVSWPTAPQASSYTLKIGGRTIQTQTASYTFNNLSRGTHQVVFAADSVPPRQSRTTTVEVIYDTQAPAARVSYSEAAPGSDDKLTLSGQALPGWNVSIGGKALEVDGSHSFKAEVDDTGEMPITFSHPTQGTHYYLRRPNNAEP